MKDDCLDDTADHKMRDIHRCKQLNNKDSLVRSLQKLSDSSWFVDFPTFPNPDDWGEAVVGWRPINPRNPEARKAKKSKFEPHLINFPFEKTNKIFPYEAFHLKRFSMKRHQVSPIFSSYYSPFFNCNLSEIRFHNIANKAVNYSLNCPSASRQKNEQSRSEIEFFKSSSNYLFFLNQQSTLMKPVKKVKTCLDCFQYCRSPKQLHKNNLNDIILPANSYRFKKHIGLYGDNHIKNTQSKKNEKKKYSKNLLQEALTYSKSDKKQRGRETICSGYKKKSKMKLPNYIL